ncbi:glucose-methanol-choline oxidoreductase (plasmid) [Neorhizobium sp. SOG26]|uniref:GMC oxidoreductase n=1 Tax=Neorhizobium sp. SOG26 TaxID=2060726 RepID=UPI000E578229|nr:GMC family oxidoreductase [Neorhizobium sp. SOG26]AXV17679.1 glucose-methanol-choline oxidoreductase [Neorhizobium sp. SOG26]
MEFESDVAIIGAGMGGAAVGYMLAKAGYRTIFLEKGLAEFVESEPDDPDSLDQSQRLRNGRWPEQICGKVNAKLVRFFPALGCGAGGSTLLYAAALERLSPQDFQAVDKDGSAAWPISYNQLEPFYQMAERLLHVSGTQDPLQPDAEVNDPPEMTECDRHFFSSTRSNGMHPYRVHTACKYIKGCGPCGGSICHKSCKQDARRAFIEPALATGRVTLVDQCVVERLNADRNGIKELHCTRNGEAIKVTAKLYVLAAGALSTPLLLLKSRNDHWPNGLANSSDLVGRNLMFHASDFFAVWPRGRTRVSSPGKSIAFRDFYVHRGVKLGVIQSTGLAATAGNALHFLKSLIDRKGINWLKPFKPLMRVPAGIGVFLYGKATIFASIIEDRPYPENRVKPHPDEPDTIYFEYTIHDELRERVQRFRDLYRSAFKRHRMMLLGSDISLNYGHACGTCRFGYDRSTAVLDSNNRAHDVPNLYVVDGSFFPTSGGANPSLTIAANALRVGAYMATELNALSQLA